MHDLYSKFSNAHLVIILCLWMQSLEWAHSKYVYKRNKSSVIQKEHTWNDGKPVFKSGRVERKGSYVTENSQRMIWNLNVKGTKMSPRKSTWLKVNSKKREKFSQSCQSCILLLEYSVDPKAFPYNKDYFELKFMQSYSSRVQEWKYGARINLVTEIINDGY